MAKLKSATASGFSLVEILVTLVIVMIGLLGLLGVQVRSHQAELESYQRAQALVLVSDMVDRISANRKGARCYGITDANSGAPFVGTGVAPPVCGGKVGVVGLEEIADADMAAWDALLQGAAEKIGATEVGAMIGARGCVTLEDPTTQTYLISVAWQGLSDTAAPTEPNAAATALTCGKDQYGDEKRKRVVFTRLRIANLK